MAPQTKQYEILLQQEMLNIIDNRRFTIQLLSCDVDAQNDGQIPSSTLRLLVNRTIHNPVIVPHHPCPRPLTSANTLDNALDTANVSKEHGADAVRYLAADKEFLLGWIKTFALELGAGLTCRSSRRTIMSWAATHDFSRSLGTFLGDEKVRRVAEMLVFNLDIQNNEANVWTPVPALGYIGRVNIRFWPEIKDDEGYCQKCDLPEDPMKAHSGVPDKLEERGKPC